MRHPSWIVVGELGPRSLWRVLSTSARSACHPERSPRGVCWQCGGIPDWRTRRLIVDFHEPVGLARFHQGVLPRLAQLRERYRAAGCAMAVGTVLREPMSQMLSEFLYFHVQFNKRLHHNATLQESTFVTCYPRPPHGMKWEPPGEPS